MTLFGLKWYRDLFGRCHRTYHTVPQLYAGLLAGDRASLARAITLIESTNPVKRKNAHILLSALLKHERDFGDETSFRIGLSGPPGSGKSTFIEGFGRHLTKLGHKLAVLAIDPSSNKTGGSLLGDKTRMLNLSRDPSAYIRPSPNAGLLGGVARYTNDAIILCESAGYSTVLVETVGVGQSEIAVKDMVDLFCLLIPPASGDELQGIKRGVVEYADLIVVNKADGELLPAARRVQAEYSSALRLLRKQSAHWHPKVVRVSSITQGAMDSLWESMQEYRCSMLACGEFRMKRRLQHQVWMWNHIRENIMHIFKTDPAVLSRLPDLEDQVREGTITPAYAAEVLLDIFRGKHDISEPIQQQIV